MDELPLWKRIDNGNFLILRTVAGDEVGNSEVKDTVLDGTEHNLIVAALRQYEN